MEPNPEISRETFIALFSPDEKINFPHPSKIYFAGNRRQIGDLGMGYLTGGRMWNPEGKGIMITKERFLISGKVPKTLYDEGFFELFVDLLPGHHVKTSIICDLLPPNSNLILEGEMGIPTQDDLEARALERYRMGTNKWKIHQDPGGSKYRIYIPADPALLSILRFSFHSNLPTTSPPLPADI